MNQTGYYQAADLSDAEPSAHAAERHAQAATTAPPRRVLFVDHTPAMGGGEIALLNLVQHIDPTRYHPIVVLFSDGDLATELQRAGVECRILPLDPRVLHTRKDSLGAASLLKLTLVFRVIGHVFRLARFIRRHRIDIVHANSLKSDIIAGLAARLARRPVIWHVRDRIEPDYLPRPVVHAFRLLARVLPTCVVANSNATLKTLRLSQTKPSAAKTSARHRTVVHDGTHARTDVENGHNAVTAPLIGLVGRISPWKGQHVFLRAAAEVRKRFPQAKFQIIGSALFAEQEYEREVRALCTELGLDDAVEFTGFRRDVPQLIDNLTVLTHASTSGEPFGQVVIEGMAAGKPVVATNGGGVPEIVVDGVTGFLVPMNNHTAMAKALCQLLEDPTLSAKMGRAGRQTVQDRFTIRHTAERVLAVYDELLHDK